MFFFQKNSYIAIAYNNLLIHTIMKKIMILLAIMLFCGSGSLNAQESNELRIKPLIGVWQYAKEVANPDGENIYIGEQIYKTITEDCNYFVMLGMNIPIKNADEENTELSTVTFITQEGEIEMTSDNTYLEYINRHYLDNNLNNIISNLRFRFHEDNPNILYVEYNLNGGIDENWVSEVWIRVMPFGAR